MNTTLKMSQKSDAVHDCERRYGASMPTTTKPLVIEFIGTFFLAFVVAIAVGGGISGGLAPFAVFAALASAIYMGGHISGAAYNPAVSCAVWVRGKCTTNTLVGYWVAQMAAGVTAALIAKSLPHLAMPSKEFAPNLSAAITVEFLFTFLLAFTVLQVATAKKTEGNSFYGAAIALVVLTGALAVGAVSSAAFNPAVGVMLLTIGHFSMSTFLVYAAVQLAAGVCAGALFKFTNADE